jgi:hypothetical protein
VNAKNFVVFALEYERTVAFERTDRGLTLFSFFDEANSICETYGREKKE